MIVEPGDIQPGNARKPFEFLFSFACLHCGKAKQVVRVGIDAGGRLVVAHPMSADCDFFRYHAAAKGSGIWTYVEGAMREIIARAEGAL